LAAILRVLEAFVEGFDASGVQFFESDFTEPGNDVCLDDVLVAVEGGGLQFAFTVGQPLAL